MHLEDGVSRDDLRARIPIEIEAGWRLRVAEIGGDLAGMMALDPIERRIDQLFISPHWQRKGVGARLVDSAKATFPSGFSLRVAAANSGAIAFYQRLGFIRTDTFRRENRGYDVHVFSWAP